MKNYSFSNKAIVRTPLGTKQIDITWDLIQQVFAKKENREALFLGSPHIYQAMELWEKGEAFQTEDDLKSLKCSLYKYVSRLSNRCTPFGLFATISAIDMASKTSINFEKAHLSRFTKYDMYFLGSFLPILTKENTIRNVLKYYPNNSLYTVFDKYRYVEYYFKDNARYHKISEVAINEYLNKITTRAKEGAVLSDLVQELVSNDISEKEAIEFMNTLIDSQFLISELEFTLTGDDYFNTLMHKFSEKRFDFYEAQVVKNLIVKLKNKISSLDQNIINDPIQYREIHQLLEDEVKNVDITKLFQVDTYRNLPNATLSYKTLKKLRNGITVLNKLYSNRENRVLNDFKQKFLERYEEYEQPLVKVLDPDIGIGYGNQSGAKTPLVDNLALSGKSVGVRQIELTTKSSFLLKKLLEAHKNNTFEITLEDHEINTFEEDEKLYPDSFSLFFNVFDEEGIEKIMLKSASGPSANGLIGRFAHLDNDILDLCNEISKKEKDLHPDKIIAEIIHLPQARTGNILYRNFQRDYEIPYLGNSSLDSSHQISVDDLYVSVKGNKIVLRSKKHNKEIIPRLGNAHNYQTNALPIYHFLCDIQSQYSSGLAFHWGRLQYDFEFLPRLSYNDVVLSRATWNITEEEIKNITSQNEKKAEEIVDDFRKRRNLPDILCIVQGDNEVLINFTNDLSRRVFFLMLKGEKFIQLKEFLFEENTATHNYCNEFIVSAYKKADVTVKEPVKYISHENKEVAIPSYSTGTEWLYYKFYCGERAGEELLNRAIHPIVLDLQTKGLVKKWFFIRYYDKNGHHLRFRVLLNDKQHFTECIHSISKAIKPFEETQIVWKTQTDTYLRELQRYGFEAIDATESLFYNDSECTLRFADMIEGDAGEQIRWKFALLSMDFLLNDLGFTIKERTDMLKAAKTSFGNEFNRSGKLNKQINEMYAKNEKAIENFLDESAKNIMYEPLWDILKERSVKNLAIAKHLRELSENNQLPSTFHQVTLSYLHMICNRIFLAKQRVHEMVVYDYLYKYYSKKLHTSKQNKFEKVEL
ncbi:lantibiotic dehydratase [Aquimarina sp. U1-2]|uniref:lantibiotic dehydratase n=1 Tax=Aquimarina sp. U1-2 TaxID=2823141 RepID=UPI001AECBBE5|nr:lantibiotic dehydratase [Aquimarina sp. U1-2]MBP2832396.1 lantibiotic dehydratase [Aquimarina sp. U1-2]